MKIWQYLRLNMKIISWRIHIKVPFTFWDMRTWVLWKVCLQTFRNNRICQKLPYFLKNLQTSRSNNSRILGTKNAKFSGYCFYMNTNIYWDFEICISVPLICFHFAEKCVTLGQCLHSEFFCFHVLGRGQLFLSYIQIVCTDS